MPECIASGCAIMVPHTVIARMHREKCSVTSVLVRVYGFRVQGFRGSDHRAPNSECLNLYHMVQWAWGLCACVTLTAALQGKSHAHIVAAPNLGALGGAE